MSVPFPEPTRRRDDRRNVLLDYLDFYRSVLRWYASPEVSAADLLDALDAGGRHTRAVGLAHDLGDVGVPVDRWRDHAAASLERVLLHLVQEYARHAGQLESCASSSTA